MRNVTISLPENVARWVRVLAAQEDKSVSRLLSEMIQARMREDEDYEAAKQEFSSTEPKRLRQAGGRLPSRDELHER